MNKFYKPTKEEIAAAAGGKVNDLIAENLQVLFCGINPSLYTAATGFNFARPGNRFWPTLYAAGFTPRLLKPYEQEELLDYGCGITNFVERATATAAEVSTKELIEGGEILVQKVLEFEPKVLAMLGITAYRTAFGRKNASIGPQPELIGKTRLWVLPNPSGLNAHYPPEALAREYGQLLKNF
ncbi:G/U mismatch-specific DNA glycosylase [Pontibacter sp. MBLB2868]|uniref:G/U mismatch-specific DNA glycosylase n=1 Tax=Pontibacter sp. MBLB2868 TaxID=3451555 RepID=UPI003F74FE51